MEELARKRTRELDEAEAFLQVYIRRSKTRDKLKRRVTNDCMFVDTDSITGFHQRFTTYNLRDRLYWMYFNKIVHSIINRAETIATERKQMKIEEITHQNQYDEYKMCTFQPSINRSRPKKGNGPVVVKGFGRFLELKELAKKIEEEKRRLELIEQ